jgi:hypothetical protein
MVPLCCGNQAFLRFALAATPHKQTHFCDADRWGLDGKLSLAKHGQNQLLLLPKPICPHLPHLYEDVYSLLEVY